MLSNEINQNVDRETKERTNKYLLNVMTVKMINILQDNLMCYIKVIGNNYKENNKVIQSINEKTLK